jgi:hypothetical protein
MSTRSRKNTERRTGCATLVLALLGALPFAAHAADGKSYPATMCHTATPANVRVDRGVFYNASAEQVYVDCPIIQDGNGNLNFAQVAALDMTADIPRDPVDKHLHQIYCALFAVKYFGATKDPGFFFFSEDGTEGMSSSFDTLHLPGGAAPPASAFNIACRIPPELHGERSGIGQYFSEEP